MKPGLKGVFRRENLGQSTYGRKTGNNGDFCYENLRQNTSGMKSDLKGEFRRENLGQLFRQETWLQGRFVS